MILVMGNDPHLGKTYGNVRLTGRIGQGSMGAIYTGWHLHFERDVAVKVMLHARDSVNARERFLREGQAAAKVQHENVVQVLDAGESNGVIYLVMELVNGYSLGKIIDDSGPMAPDVVARLGASISLGLAAIHAKGILHRDIKPDNILVGTDQKPKITDLGLAKQTDDPEVNRLTATGMVVGTPLYVAPENIRDPKSSTTAIDIYSLGATLYHMLTGRPPFEANTPYDVMRAHLEQRPQPIREIRPAVPTGLAQLVERCLHKNPERRPTAIALAEQLSQGNQLKAKANRGLALLIGISSLVVLCCAGISWVLLSIRHDIEIKSPKTATLLVHADQPAIKVAIDGGDWIALTTQPISISSGHHHVVVQNTQLGAQLSYEHDVDASEHQHLELAATLTPKAVTPLPIPVAGSDMLFCNGSAFGVESSYPVNQAGTYALAHWDGTTWSEQLSEVTARGQINTTQMTVRHHPTGGAYWRTVDDTGAAMLPYHVLCWWEAEYARAHADLPVTPGWLAQGEHREQPALGLTPELIEAVCNHLGTDVVVLPDQEQASQLAGVYQTAVWCTNKRHLDYIGSGSPRTAMLILLPAHTTPAVAAAP